MQKKEGNLFQKLKEIGLFDGGWKIRENSITHVGTVIGNLDSFAKGAKSIPKDMLAITQEAGFEFIRTDDGMLTPLKKGILYSVMIKVKIFGKCLNTILPIYLTVQG